MAEKKKSYSLIRINQHKPRVGVILYVLSFRHYLHFIPEDGSLRDKTGYLFVLYPQPALFTLGFQLSQMTVVVLGYLGNSL